MPPAEVPGSSTKMFFALLGPTLSIPTLLYWAGVPGAAKPFIQVTRSGAVAELACVLEGELAPQLERSMTRHTTAIETEAGRFGIDLIM